MLNEKTKVFIKIDEKDNIININSSVFIKDTTDWIFIDEGYGDKYAHASTQYLEKDILDENGCHNYKYINEKVLEKTAEEKAEEKALFPKVYTAQDDMDAMLVDHEYRLTLLELGV